MASNSERSRIVCSFCKETFHLPDELKKHLITCATKTEQCPRCLKLVQRAIFAYHYENNCTNPDLDCTNNRTKSTATNSGVCVSVKCERCGVNFRHGDRRNHQNQCSTSSINGYNGRKNIHPNDDDEYLNGTNPGDLTSFYPSAEKNNRALIPCEFCNRSIPFESFQTHTMECRKTVRSNPDSTLRQNNDGRVKCRRCSVFLTPEVIEQHERYYH